MRHVKALASTAVSSRNRSNVTTAILNERTPIGYALPPVSRRLSPELNRVVGESGNDVQTLHNDPEAAAREGLREPIAVASRPAALIYRMMLMCFGEGWIVGGKGSLTYRRPLGIRDFVTAKGTVKEIVPEGADGLRIICEVWVETDKGVKAIVGSCSGVVRGNG